MYNENMEKIKDTLLLLFWDLIAGAFFVGCILGFMYIFNHAGELFHFQQITFPFGKDVVEIIALSLLAGVIYGAIKLISWVWTKTHKGYWETADKIFPQEVLLKIRSNSLASAVVNGNEWAIMRLMGKHKNEWPSRANQTVADGITALHIAVAVENKSACDTLLYFKADPLRQDRQGRTSLDYAVQSNNQAIIKLLEKHIKK